MSKECLKSVSYVLENILVHPFLLIHCSLKSSLDDMYLISIIMLIIQGKTGMEWDTCHPVKTWVSKKSLNSRQINWKNWYLWNPIKNCHVTSKPILSQWNSVQAYWASCSTARIPINFDNCKSWVFGWSKVEANPKHKLKKIWFIARLNARLGELI